MPYLWSIWAKKSTNLQLRSELLGRKKTISPFRDDFYCFYFLNPRWKNIIEISFKPPGSLTCMPSHFSHVWVFATPGTAALQAPPSMGSSRQEYWSGVPCPPPGDLPDPGIKPSSLKSPELVGGFFITSTTWLFQFSSVAQSCLTLCDPMNHSTPGLPVHHQLLVFTQTHVHRVGDTIPPSHTVSFPAPPAPNPSQHHGLFQWVNSSHEVAKVLEFQLQHQSFQWTPRTDLL